LGATFFKKDRQIIMRSAVIIKACESVALIERIRDGQTYYLFPGGTVETEETLEAAAVREAREELGLEIRLGQLAAIVEFDGTLQYYFWATPVAGEFGSGNGEELSSSSNSQRGSYRPMWLNIEQLASDDVRPKVLAVALSQGTLIPCNEVLHIQDQIRSN
jgi:ADP-ribose pyrophosphatase YjhB (NUDIX family)